MPRDNAVTAPGCMAGAIGASARLAHVPTPNRHPLDGTMLERRPGLHLMSSNTLVLVACLAVAVILVLGLANMMRGGSASVSQRLMRLRVLLQFVAIVIIMGVVWWRSA